MSTTATQNGRIFTKIDDPVLISAPKDWEVVPLKRVARLQYGDSLSSEFREDGSFKVYGSNGPVGSHSEANTFGPALIVGRKGSFGKVVFTEYPAFAIDTTYYIDSRHCSHNLRWLFYILSVLKLDGFSKDSAIPGLDRDDAYIRRIPLPPRVEQDAIVGYLDAKLEQIDRFITNKRHLIELLEEERQRTIHMAITRGMNPDVKLKPTGIKWLPQIPQHWEMRRNGTLFDERKQKGHEDLPVLMVSINTAVTLDRPNQVREQQQIADKEKYAFAAKNDIAFNMMRMWQGAVGVVPVDGNVSPAYVVCKPRQNVDPRYYELLFRTKLYQGEVFCYSYGIVLDRNRLYWIGFKSIFSPYPPIEEQKEIIKKISTMTKEVEEAKSKAQAEIDLINEFRTSLIAEAVTGKIEINNK